MSYVCIIFHAGQPQVRVYKKIGASHPSPPQFNHTLWLCVHYGTNKVRDGSKRGRNSTNTVINRKLRLWRNPNTWLSLLMRQISLNQFILPTPSLPRSLNAWPNILISAWNGLTCIPFFFALFFTNTFFFCITFQNSPHTNPILIVLCEWRLSSVMYRVCTLRSFTYVNFFTIHRNLLYRYPFHFVDEETEARRVNVTCSRLLSH